MSLNCFDAGNANNIAGEWKTNGGHDVVIPNWQPLLTGAVVGEIKIDDKWHIAYWSNADARSVPGGSVTNCTAFDLAEREREGRKYSFLP